MAYASDFWDCCISVPRESAYPTAGAGSAASTREGRFRIHAHTMVGIRVDALITNAVPVLVHPSQRLLKQARLRVTLRHCAFQDVQLILVHGDEGIGTGLIRIAG